MEKNQVGAGRPATCTVAHEGKSNVQGKRQVGRARPVGDIVLRGHAGAASGRVAGLAEPGKDWMGPSQKNAKPEPWEGNR